MLTAVIQKKTISEIQSAINSISNEIDLIELRLDYLTEIDLKQLAKLRLALKLPVIFTLRAKSQGGKFTNSENHRLQLIRELCRLAPDYFDLEYTIPPHFISEIKNCFPKLKLISSYHNFHETPENLEQLFLQLKNNLIDIYKITTYANSSLDALHMMLFRKNHLNENIIAFCMGECGIPTRIAGKIFGNLWAYAALDQNSMVVPYQLSLDEFINIYNFKNINQDSRIYGLIGDPVAHSLGHVFHNHYFKTNQINAVYLKFKLSAAELSDFFNLAKQLPIDGLSVTMPLKSAVIPYLAQLDNSINDSVNTIKIANGLISGITTDGQAACDAIEQQLSLSQQAILILGAGGAARSFIPAAKLRQAEVTVSNRSSSKALELAQSYQIENLEFLSSWPSKKFSVLINSLPNSAYEDPRVLAWLDPLLRKQPLVMDMNYFPEITPLLEQAQKYSCPIIGGKEMFVRQAELQEKFWQAATRS